ncbi:M15 family metallopeptidase [Clostridium chrysemydis]|uniref:M15 family metallopeptidase n=1 Tax=Clostridium chrysemydis TaxID=2665504 RepID=UPI001883F500|nr:M15 family metallopeptidase [Clostridium chrysemydis]
MGFDKETRAAKKTIIKNDIILINDSSEIGENYKSDLVEAEIEFVNEADKEERLVSKQIKKPLQELINRAKEDGILLLGTSGYRSYNTQKYIYKREVMIKGKRDAKKYVAEPGQSEHQTGLCIDLTNPSRLFIGGTKEADWLKDNCYKYGFIVRYKKGKEKITKKNYEPWHIRYVGKKVAKEIYEKGICLEEYLGEAYE